MARKPEPIHPGEVLLADFLELLGLSQYRLSHGISLNLQARYDFEVERDRLGKRLKAEVEVFRAAS